MTKETFSPDGLFRAQYTFLVAGGEQLNARTNVNGDAGLYVISPERAKVWFGSVDIYRQL